MTFEYYGKRDGFHIFECTLKMDSWVVISPFRAEHTREIMEWFETNYPTAVKEFEHYHNTNILLIEDDEIAMMFKLAWL